MKLWIRDAVSLCLWAARRLWRRPHPQGVRILLYHAIAQVPPHQDRWRMSVPPALFHQHLRWLRAHGYAVVPLREAIEMVQGTRPMPTKAIAVTFDDGFRDILSEAMPILERDEVPATLFVAPGLLDGVPPPGEWQSLGEVRLLTWDDLRTLTTHPLITIGSHGWSHRLLSELETQTQEEEIQRSKQAIETHLSRPVQWFAYPYGHRRSFTAETIASLKRAGYEAACANIMGVNRPGDSVWALRRTRIGWEDSLWRFRLKVAGAYDWVDR